MIGQLRQRARALGRMLMHEHTAPARMGAAVLVGCIVGCTPLFGFHLLVCVAVAWLLGLNKLVVYGAANLSIPPMVPLLGFASVQLGERILYGRWFALTRAQLAIGPARAWEFFRVWMVGGVALGAAIGIVAGGLTWAALARRRAAAARRARAAGDERGPAPLAPSLRAGQEDATATGAARGLTAVRATVEAPTAEAATAAATAETAPARAVADVTAHREAIDAAIADARRRYDGLHPRFKWYARMKYVMDPCYRALAGHIREGAFVVDLGTGLGMLPVLLGVLGGARRALGVEWDAAKVACGEHAARGLMGVQVVAGDARSFVIPACDVITLVDMLHYWDADTQRALLARCRAALATGGRLLVREGDPERRGGARFTRAVEAMVTRLGWNRGPAVRFRPLGELRADLEALGFAVRVDEVAGRTHPGNVLLVADLNERRS